MNGILRQRLQLSVFLSLLSLGSGLMIAGCSASTPTVTLPTAADTAALIETPQPTSSSTQQGSVAVWYEGIPSTFDTTDAAITFAMAVLKEPPNNIVNPTNAQIKAEVRARFNIILTTAQLNGNNAFVLAAADFDADGESGTSTDAAIAFAIAVLREDPNNIPCPTVEQIQAETLARFGLPTNPVVIPCTNTNTYPVGIPSPFVSPSPTPTPADCPAGPEVTTTIPQVQGSGATTPVIGQTVVVQGVVTGDFQDDDADTSRNLDGFYLQDEIGDGDPLTSDGIFVFGVDGLTTDVEVGDIVRVAGTVDEFFDETQIDTVTQVFDCGVTGTITPLTISLPLAEGETLENPDGGDGPGSTTFPITIPNLEAYEGMLVTFPDTLTATEHFELGRYGQVLLSQGGRLRQYTSDNPPSVSGFADYQNEIVRRTIFLDDGLSNQNPDPIVYPANPDGLSGLNTLRIGDTVTGATGVIRFSRGSGANGDETYRLMATDPFPSFTSVNTRPASAPSVGGDITVASFNVLNYFTTLGSRGAENSTEFTRQKDKIVQAIVTLDADIVGLIEIENNGATAINDLVNAVNTVAGAGTYAAIPDPAGYTSLPGGDDAIKVAIIYKPDAVTPEGSSLTVNDSRFAEGRAPVAQEFNVNATDGSFVFVINHFKSKGSAASLPGDDDQGDGQGQSNATRVAQAEALLDFVTNSLVALDPDILLTGDFNAYDQEDPIVEMENAGFVNVSSGSGTYSFVFDGQSGSLDHALASSTLTSQVNGAEKWHINADEPGVLDYNTNFKSAGQQASLYNADPYRSSDHDPVVVGLSLADDGPIAADTTPPTLTSSTPTDNAVDVDVTANLVLTFDENVQAATGDVVITNTGDGSDTRTIDITDASQVTFSNNTVTINPTTDLLFDADYDVTIAAGVIEDLAGNDFAGITSPTLNFATESNRFGATLPFTENFNTFAGAGFASTPAAGQLNSNFWIANGLSDDTDMDFGDTKTSGDFARGTSAAAVTGGGIYAFDVGSSNFILGVQPTGTDFNSAGQFVLQLENTTGGTITSLDVSYTIRYRNDQARSSTFNFAHSPNDNGTGLVNVGSLDFATPLALDALGWQSEPKTTTITGLSIPDGGFYYLYWLSADNGGSGSRDEFGLDDVSVAVSP